MTTEETELTFIRCPNCRSLVPAVASRCRMCGYHFEGDSDENTAEDSAKKSRVRQRTVSVSKDEVEDITNHVVAEEPEEPEYVQAADPDGGGEFEAAADETGNLEESWPTEAAGLFSDQSSYPEEETADPEVEEFREKEDISDFFSFSEEEKEKEESEVFSENVEEVVFSKEDGDEGKETLSESEQEDHKPAAVGEHRYQPDVEDDTEDTGVEDEAAAETRNEDVRAEQEERPSGRRRRRKRRKKRPSAVDSDRAAEDTAADITEDQGFEKEKEEMAAFESSVSHEAFEKSGAEEHKGFSGPVDPSSLADEGALVGWLVSYSQDQKGIAGEIRGGRFFVGRQRLRSNDMVIADSAVSTPHCLVSAGVPDGLFVQDLMSDQGTFIKKSGDNSFVRVQDSTRVEHGDSLRFGGYEVLVCLVPQSR